MILHTPGQVEPVNTMTTAQPASFNLVEDGMYHVQLAGQTPFAGHQVSLG